MPRIYPMKTSQNIYYSKELVWNHYKLIYLILLIDKPNLSCICHFDGSW
jgi:hypothetical protein